MTTETLTPAGSTARQQRHAERVRRLRTRGASGRLDRWLLVVGGAMVPLGLLVVVLGWLGASHTVLVFEQLPYVVSGGMLGTALVFGGGFVYFSYWQTVRVRDARAQHRELVDGLHRIESLLLQERGPGAARSPAAGPAVAALVATATGNLLHRPDCPVAAGRDNLRPVVPGTQGLRPCRICSPLADD